MLFIYNISFTSQQQKFSGNNKYCLHGKKTRECAPHGYVKSLIPYNVTFVDWEAVLCSVFLRGCEHHLNTQPVLQCESWSALQSVSVAGNVLGARTSPSLDFSQLNMQK